jgi:hypothetical protein
LLSPSLYPWRHPAGCRLFGDRQELFYGIVDDTFNGEKIPTEQQLGRLNRSLSRAGIDPSDNGVVAILGFGR